MLLLGSLSVIAAIYLWRRSLYSEIGPLAQVVASVANAIQIAIFNVIYAYIATILNDWENHRTESEYEAALVAKLFYFQFVNSYSSCFYIAFIAEYMPVPPGSPTGAIGECGGPDCMEALSINLGIIFLLQILNGSILKVGPAYIWTWFKSKEFHKQHAVKWIGALFKALKSFRTISLPESEYLLMQHDILTISIYNYTNIVIQFG